MPDSRPTPGVYIEEIPSGARKIEGAPTAVTAFVGRARRGPVDEPIEIDGIAGYERVFGGFWDESPLSFAVWQFFEHGGEDAIVTRVYEASRGAGHAAVKLAAGSAKKRSRSAGALVLEATSPGTWGNDLSVTVEHRGVEAADESTFDLRIAEVVAAPGGGLVTLREERHRQVSVEPASPRFVESVLADSELVRAPSIPGRRPRAVDGEPLTGGNDGAPVTDPTILGTRDGRTGLYSLADVRFNLLCVPPPSFTTDLDPSTRAAIVDYCAGRRVFHIVDPPWSWTTVSAAAAGVEQLGIRDRDAAVYFPHLTVDHPDRAGESLELPPCGAVAGLYARTDAAHGVWKAPAGIDAQLLGVPTVATDDSANGWLNPLGVNGVRKFPTIGTVVWGARTLADPATSSIESRYVSVRRTVLFIEGSLSRGLQWVVFEPNDEPLWAEIYTTVGSFMQGLFRQGAFQGSSSSDSYLVKCDSETTTRADIDAGVVNVLVGFAPLQPAEFVIISLRLPAAAPRS